MHQLQLEDHTDDLVRIQLSFVRGEATSGTESSHSLAQSTAASRCSLWVQTAAITDPLRHVSR